MSYGEEKRGAKRYPANFAVTFEADKGRSFKSLISGNISMNGVYIVSHDLIPPGTEGVVIISLKCQGRLVIAAPRARIVRVVSSVSENSTHGMGIMFHSLNRQTEKNLQLILKELTGGVDN